MLRSVGSLPIYPSTFHNGESSKSTLLPGKRVLNGSNVEDEDEDARTGGSDAFFGNGGGVLLASWLFRLDDVGP